jgi:hypothetical protein
MLRKGKVNEMGCNDKSDRQREYRREEIEGRDQAISRTEVSGPV